MAGSVDRAARARIHAALGDAHRLAIVDALRLTDRTPGELRTLVDVPSNLLAFHLDVLEEAGVVTRRRSQGDGRRRYVSLHWPTLAQLGASLGDRQADWDAAVPRADAGDPEAGRGRRTPRAGRPVVFVCTRNAARSQLAAALWRDRTDAPAVSAGSAPATAPDDLAVEVATRHGLDARGWTTTGYDGVVGDPSLVVSVCDRAREAGVPWSAPQLHWSVPDPHGGGRTDYERAFAEIAARVDRLAASGVAGDRA